MGMPLIHWDNITKETAVGSIIESVVMEEDALAHILNAESEKLLAIANHPGVSFEELLAVNRSVNETISSIIGLELLLKAKLELYRDTICQ